MTRFYSLTWDGAWRNLMVAVCPTRESAVASSENLRFDSGIVVGAPEDLAFAGPQLVCLYNAIGAIYDEDLERKAVSRFATRADGQRRVFEILEANAEKFKEAPKAAAPSTVDTQDAANEEGEDQVAKGKKVKAKKAPRAKKAPADKKAKSTAIVREDSSRGKLLRLAVENPGISIKSLASRADISGEGSLDASGRVRLRLRKVLERIEGSSVSFDDGVVVKLPAGMTLAKAFGK